METNEILDSTPAVSFVLLNVLDEQGRARHALNELARGRATRSSVDLIASLRDYTLPAEMRLSVIELARSTAEAIAASYIYGGGAEVDAEVIAKAATTSAAILVSSGEEVDPRRVDRDELDATLGRLADRT